MVKRIAEAAEEFDAGLSDDLNTARALGAVFEFMREANIAMDKGEFGSGDVPAAQKFLQTFDQIFAVLVNNDAQKFRFWVTVRKASARGCGDRKTGRRTAGGATDTGLYNSGPHPKRARKTWYNS